MAMTHDHDHPENGGPDAPDENAVIRVNGVAISAAAIRQEAQNHPSKDLRTALGSAARALVVRELLLQEAKRLNIAPAAPREGLGDQKDDQDALIDALLDQEVNTPTADESDCRRYFTNNPTKFCSDDLYEARHILIAAAPEDTAGRESAKAAVADIISILQDTPERFAEMAQAHSACPSREQGGNLGQISPGQTVPEFETFLFNLDEGQLCPVPVPTPFGIHIIQLDRKIEGRPLEFDTVRPRIAAYLEAASWSRAMAQYVSILAGAAQIDGIDLMGAEPPLVQ